MKRLTAVVALGGCLAAGSFAGTLWVHRSGTAGASAHAATVYACPMHPDYRSDHPGDCPVCGMRLDVVRAGGAAVPARPDGAVQVSPDRQQAIGVRVGVVGRAPGTRRLRTTGRVAPDENRTYPLVAAVSGWIRDVASVTTGDAVKKDQVLASFLAPELEFRNAQQSYYTTLDAFYRMALTQQPPPAQARSHPSSRGADEIERMADELRTLGVTNSQLREIGQRRELVRDIRVESPVDGFVLKRNVSPGLRFDRGFELYRIADVSRVWILADVYRDDVPLIRRGASARITTAEGSHALRATVSPSEPIFDEATLTLKVRLEAANPQRALKPGMFVDVEFPVDLPPALVVPADAIVNSGLRKTVFVERGHGSFEPRLVETGSRIGDDVEVTKGLEPGERIVISGTFFIDSESRMKAGTRAASEGPQLDPVCGMHVDPREAGEAGRTAVHGESRFYFCSDSCKRQFVADPSRHAKTTVANP
jgi:Cu(I)/Ag(I) efflux system membrane fusion protein